MSKPHQVSHLNPGKQTEFLPGATAFTAIDFCLTIIFAYNGFKFYNTLFGEKPLKRFLKQVKNHYERTGKLLPLQKLTPNTRQIMKYLKEVDRESLEELLEK